MRLEGKTAEWVRLGKGSVNWDPKTEKSDDEEVNKMLSRPMRKAYSI